MHGKFQGRIGLEEQGIFEFGPCRVGVSVNESECVCV